MEKNRMFYWFDEEIAKKVTEDGKKAMKDLKRLGMTFLNYLKLNK